MSDDRPAGAAGLRRDLPDSTRARRALVGALFLLVAVRVLPIFDIYQGGAVVLSGNDPYAYRHAVDAMLSGEGAPWSLPAGVATGEPLLVTTLWLGSLLLGGSEVAADHVVAWYPVLVALLTGVLVYGIAVRASRDPRIGLAAVVLLAVTPANAFRTSLGFADHHAFDALWLSLTAYALLVVLTRERRDRATWAYAGLLGVGVAGQLLAWAAGPLLVLPAGFAVAASAPAFLRERVATSPLVPAVAGLGLGALLTALAHVGLGWHSLLVPASAALLALGGVGVLVLVALARRLAVHWAVLLVVEVVILSVAVAVAWATVPGLEPAARAGIEFLLRDTRIGEMSSLGEAYGNVLGPLIILGFAPFLAVPAVGLAARKAWQTGSPAWPIVTVYAVHFAALTVIQRRFGGEFAPFLAVLGGLGFVALLVWLAIARPTRSGDDPPDPPVGHPDRTRLLLLGALSSVFVGGGALYTTFINGRITIDPNAIRAARWIRDYADERGWTYPENYVLSEWGRNRMYNYVVNGQSRSYGYAQQNYESFIFGTDPDEWYDQFEGRVGFVVTRDFEHVGTVRSTRTYTRLHSRLGSAADGAPGVGHYRAVYSGPDDEYRVFTVVPGATLTGTADGPILVSTTVSIAGAEFEYARRVEPAEDGSFEVIVAHPGPYRLGDRRVAVTETDVLEGHTVSVQ